MKTRNFKLNPPVKKKTERERDLEKQPSINPDTNLPFNYIWVMSVPGEECGNPQVSKCPSRKFKTRLPAVYSFLNGKVFHFPRCFKWADSTNEELEKKVRKPNAKVRTKKAREYKIA